MSIADTPRHQPDRLDDYDRALIAALASGKSTAEAAVAAGLSVPTVYRRARRPWFKAALTEARVSQFAPAMSAAVAALPRTVETFLSVMDDPAAKNADKINAAKAVVDVALRLGDQIDLRTDLAAIQVRLDELNNRDTERWSSDHSADYPPPFNVPPGVTSEHHGSTTHDR